MAYKISSGCMGCDNCRPQCPTGAINVDSGHFWINPALCNNCEGFFPEPQCVVQCPTSAPVPSQAKKGRVRSVEARPVTSPDLFPNGRNNPFASAIVVWEACNLLAQRQTLPWRVEADGRLGYERPINQGKGLIHLGLRQSADSETEPTEEKALALLESLDIRAACLHLLYAAHATALAHPWEQEFVLSDRQIEEYLGLDKRKDLSKPAKLTLIKELAQQPCLIQAAIQWPQQGRMKGFVVETNCLWEMVEMHHHFQEDDLGCKHLVGLTFRLRAGEWAKYFLNKQGCQDRTAFYQYGNLPRSLLPTIMSIWQQHEGSARMMLWLLFKARMGKEQRITVPTLMRVAYGEERVTHATSQREDRKRLLRTFENDLAVLSHYGLKPIFDPVTYPTEIQPLWARLVDLPDDAEDALEFWINDASSDNRLTDIGPRGKWNLLMNARILWFELPADWSLPKTEPEKRKRQPTRKKQVTVRPSLSGDQIAEARRSLGWSQRDLAERTGKSQSWIRDIERGRFRVKAEDQSLLRQVLELG